MVLHALCWRSRRRRWRRCGLPEDAAGKRQEAGARRRKRHAALVAQEHRLGSAPLRAHEVLERGLNAGHVPVRYAALR